MSENPSNGWEIWRTIGTIGTIVGSVSGILALILQLDKLAALGKRIYKWVATRCQMVKQWWHWKWHSPVCLVVKTSPLRITKSDGFVETEVTINWRSREITSKTNIESKMLLDIGGTIPRLICSSVRLALSPRGKTGNIVCKFKGNIHVPSFTSLDALLKEMDSTVKCRIIVEKIWGRGFPDKSMNLKPFRVNIEYID